MFREAVAFAKLFCATNDEMFVLIVSAIFYSFLAFASTQTLPCSVYFSNSTFSKLVTHFEPYFYKSLQFMAKKLVNAILLHEIGVKDELNKS